MERKRLIKFIFLFVFAVFLIPSVLPLFNKGIFLSDDSTWMIIRLTDFHRSLRDGQFPVRWAGRLSYGYGYPVFNFSYPLFLYIGEVFKVIGFNFINSIKFVYGLSLVLSSVFSYFWLRGKFSRVASFTGALVYLYVPYHISDVYRRGSIGEVLALVFLPIILMGIDYLKEGKKEKWALLLISLGVGGLVTAHNILAMLAVPFLFGYFLFLLLNRPRKTLLIKGLFLFGLGFGVSAFFWIPAIYDIRYTIFGLTKVTVYAEHFVPFINLIFPKDTMSNIPTASVFSFILILVSTVFLITEKNIEKKILGFYFVLTSVASLFLVTNYSYPFWKTVIFLQLMQFPWRLIALTILPLSFLAGLVVDKFTGMKRNAVMVLILITLFAATYPYLKPAGFVYQPEGYYSTNEHNTTIGNEYISKWSPDPPVNHAKSKVEVLKGNAKVNILESYSNRTIFNVDVTENAFIRVNTTYFPWWKVYVDGKETEIVYNNVHGLIEFWVNGGKHRIETRLVNTPVWNLSNTISVLSFMILGVYFVFVSRKR